jgi:hypothetical protein
MINLSTVSINLTPTNFELRNYQTDEFNLDNILRYPLLDSVKYYLN